ncbi:S1 family peptidase [Vibrio bivalvicida]|uniref:Trypsin-like serine protease n=1 Tax=Vibrio bivalvicida TaxID=1276888 RepID=A0ABV4MI40_9VIBR
MSRWSIPLALSCSGLITASALATEITPYIINGTNANQSDWPYITALVKKNQDAYTGQFCGGSLIKDRYVLTAAHCVNDLKEEGLDVIVGINNLNNTEFEGVRVPVKSIFVHHWYESATLNHDVAILELEEPVSSNIAAPVSTAVDRTRSELADGTSLKVAGWGSTTPEYGNPTSPAILQELIVPLVNQTTCSQTYADIEDSVFAVNFCAGTPTEGYDSCRGDSGSPIIIENTGVQLGLVSWGSTRCGAQGTYGVYTNLSGYESWIEQKSDGLSYKNYEHKGFVGLGTYTHTFRLTNYSSDTASFSGNPTFTSLTYENTSEVVSDGCAAKGSLTQNESCDITVRYSVSSYGDKSYSLTVNYNQGYGTQAEFKLELEAALAGDSSLASALNLSQVEAYTDDNPWVLYGSNGVKSAPISHLEKSTLILDGVPAGNYEFDVKLASESSDLLYLYVNGESRGGVGGERSFTHSLPLTKTSNRIKFVYQKDASIDASDDAVYISNFRTAGSTTTSTTPTTNSGGGGGGSLGWLSLGLLVLAARRR